MKYQAWIVILFCFSGASVFGQINHWESLVLESDIWSYRLGTSEPSSNWNTTNFASSSWSVGAGGIGYGDGDDITTISNTPSLYMRIEFNVNQVQLMNALIFHADYDDGFIAYLNGIEIARANVDTLTPSFNYSPPYEREAKVYQGGKSSMWVIDEDLWKGSLLNGTNVLAVHTMNHQGTNSSDMSARYWLHCGVTVSTLVNSLPASWFNFNAFESPVAVCRINSYEELIEDDPSIRAEMEIVWNDSSSSFASYGKAENLKTYIEIEKRGRWSQFVYPKNGYAIEAKDSSWEDTDIEPIGMPKEEDWVLHGPYGDRTFMRNKLAMHMARKQGNYASRTEFVELIINGEYEGIYVLMEKIKRGPDRVDIAKLKQDEITGDDLTGGYIFKTDWQPVDWYSTFDMLTSSNKIPYTYTYPKRKNIVVQQEQYIQKFVDDFEHALQNTNTPYNGKYWYEYIDISSFVDFFLMMEISKDVDAYRASTYYHKDKDSKGGKVHAGPIWDFNFAFGTVDYCNGYIPTGWMYSGNPCSGTNPAWWEKLVNTPAFANAVNCRWNELMTTVWHPDSLAEFISSKAALIAPAVGRNHNRWPTSNPAAVKYIGLNYEDDVDIMKDFLMQRILWLNANMIGNSCMDSNISKPYDVSFAVDMNPYAGIYDTVFVSGDFNSWSGNSHPLSDNDGDGIWTGTYAINQDSIEFKYILDNWQVNESLNVNLPCTKTSGNNTNRFAVLNSNLFVSSCWESCLTCFQSGLGYDTVKFEVNTANIIVGPNGIYAGGGILGGARAVKLHDPDGNGIYTGDTIIDGSVGGKFIFLNSPSSDSDWGAKENLVGLPCADPANWNDRTFPIFSKDTTLQFCYETCSTNSLCSPNLPNHYNVTFKVNTLGVNIGPNGLYAGGGVLGWANAVTLTDTDNDGVWEGSAIVNGVNSGNFAFFNSPNFSTDWGTKEVLTGLPCADPSHYDDRIMPNFTQDTTLLFCFGSCETDGSCPAPAVPKNVSLAVDMNQYSGSTANGVFLNGDFNGWCGSCNAMDDSDGDGVWTVTLPLTADSIEYKFTVDGWNDQEMFAPGLSCTKSGGIYTNRFVAISGDTTLATVCWNSCSSCITVPPPPPANTCIKCDSLNIGDFFLVDGDSIEVVDRTRLLAIVAAQGDLTKVCVSHVTDMKNILRGATWFNQDISRWDVSNVTNMNSMFFKNRKFNQDLSAWDVSSVTNMLGMFSRCDSFNQNLNTWDVSA
ncbi:CotH kinase family protein, partial [Schleiferiaceae bacterium]|nr:CotH kinase family protein [Schleiferiaceae bacterium]